MLLLKLCIVTFRPLFGGIQGLVGVGEKSHGSFRPQDVPHRIVETALGDGTIAQQFGQIPGAMAYSESNCPKFWCPISKPV